MYTCYLVLFLFVSALWFHVKAIFFKDGPKDGRKLKFPSICRSIPSVLVLVKCVMLYAFRKIRTPVCSTVSLCSSVTLLTLLSSLGTVGMDCVTLTDILKRTHRSVFDRIGFISITLPQKPQFEIKFSSKPVKN